MYFLLQNVHMFQLKPKWNNKTNIKPETTLVLQRTNDETHFDEIKIFPSDLQHSVELNVTAFEIILMLWGPLLEAGHHGYETAGQSFMDKHIESECLRVLSHFNCDALIWGFKGYNNQLNETKINCTLCPQYIHCDYLIFESTSILYFIHFFFAFLTL